MASGFDPASLRAAVAQTIASSTVPDHHGFATIVDLNGAHVALATRVGDGWTLDLNGGYDWEGPTPGAAAQFTLGKSW